MVTRLVRVTRAQNQTDARGVRSVDPAPALVGGPASRIGERGTAGASSRRGAPSALVAVNAAAVYAAAWAYGAPRGRHAYCGLLGGGRRSAGRVGWLRARAEEEDAARLARVGHPLLVEQLRAEQQACVRGRGADGSPWRERNARWRVS